MSIFDSAETKFCKQLFHFINDGKSAPLVHVLCANHLFDEETAIRFSLYTFGFCMGALDVEFPKRYSPTVCDRLAHRLTDLFVMQLKRELIQPSVPAQQRDGLVSSVVRESNSNRSYVQYVLTQEPASSQLRLISTSYRDILGIHFYDLDDEAQSDFDAAVKFMVDFSVTPFPFPVL